MTITRKIYVLIALALVVCGAGLLFALSALSSVVDAANSTAAQEAVSSARMQILILGGIGLLTIAGVGYFFLRSIVKPLHSMEQFIARAADELDFTDNITVDAQDEVGRALMAYKRLLERIRNSFSSMQNATMQLLDVTEDVDRSSRKIARNSQMQSDASANMAAAVEEMTVSISMVAQQAQDASDYTKDSRETAESSAGAILTTVSGIQKISDSVREVSTRIKALRADCDSISSVAKIIREIADQTNLLALNAAIEAARAGEQGRGFAVVADEVRKLAERTANSTQEISSLLSKMQESAKLAVNSMTTTEAAVSHGVENARLAGDSIDRIKEGSNAVAGVVEEISGAISEQQTVSSSISQHIEQVAQMSEQNSVNAGESAKAMGKMALMGHELSNALSIFKIDNNERKIVIKVADINPEDHPAVRALTAMGEMLKQRSQGRITMKVVHSGTQGAEPEVLEQLRMGTMDMTRVNMSQLSKTCPLVGVPAMPFLFRSIEHMQRAMDGAPGDEILASCAEGGLMGVAFYDSGVRNIYANKPVKSMADTRGLKLRIPPSDLWVAVATAMGAKAVPMGIGEVKDGQRMGLVEAAENNLPSYEGFKHFEVFKYFCSTEHAMPPDIVVFSKKRWDSLSADDQKLIRDAAKESVLTMRRLWSERENSARRNMQAAGTVFVTDVDKQSFQSAMRPVYEKFITSPQQKALLKAIQELK